jgi:hypothetical protein
VLGTVAYSFLVKGSNERWFVSKLTTLNTVSGNVDDVPPPGDGFATLIVAHPSVATLLASTVAVSWEGLTKVVESAFPFNCIDELELKPEPLT